MVVGVRGKGRVAARDVLLCQFHDRHGNTVRVCMNDLPDRLQWSHYVQTKPVSLPEERDNCRHISSPTCVQSVAFPVLTVPQLC